MSDTLKNIAQHKLLSQIHTDNPFMDAILHVFIFTMITGILNILTNMSSKMLPEINNMYHKIYRLVYDMFSHGKEREKEVQIDYISDNKQVNELYKAVSWYLSNNNLIDYEQESFLKYVHEKPINKINDPVTVHINKIITNNKWNILMYNKKTIKYYLTHGLITIYGDKERKKENYTIILRAQENKTLDDFCQKCIKEYSIFLHGTTWSQKIFINVKGKWEGTVSNNRRRLGTIALKEGQLEDLLDDLETFTKSEPWYHEHDIPYSRGYLLYGPPGTGKTSIIKGISNHTQRHIHYLNLNQITDDNELIVLLKDIQYKETILVIEDIDAMTNCIKDRMSLPMDSEISKKLEKLEDTMNKISTEFIHNSYDNYPRSSNRTNNENKKTLSLSTLLNAIDGVFNNDGRILIMTSNHPETLDQALLRPGRIDRKFYLSYCDHYQLAKLYSNFYSQACDQKQLSCISENTLSPAYCSGILLKYKNVPLEALSHIGLNEHVDLKQHNIIPVSDTLCKDEKKETNEKNEKYEEHSKTTVIQHKNPNIIIKDIFENNNDKMSDLTQIVKDSNHIIDFHRF